MERKFVREVGRSRPWGSVSEDRVTEGEVTALPPVVQRYLHFMGAVGKPRTWSFRSRATGSFRLKPDAPWLACEAWQYNSRLGVARFFHMRLRLHGVPVYVRDTYAMGRGRMRGRLFDLMSIVDDSSEEVAIGELVTYLNDAILFAPSMVLVPEATWTEVSDDAFDVTLTDSGRTVRARVTVDADGAATNFHTTDRYGTDPDRPKTLSKALWSTPVRDWRSMQERRVPTGGSAVWHFPGGDFEYANFHFAAGDLEFDVPPSGRLLRF